MFLTSTSTKSAQTPEIDFGEFGGGAKLMKWKLNQHVALQQLARSNDEGDSKLTRFTQWKLSHVNQIYWIKNISV